jgi:hypothetical protein
MLAVSSSHRDPKRSFRINASETGRSRGRAYFVGWILGLLRIRTLVLNICGRMLILLLKLIKIGAKVVSHGRYVAFQMAEVAIPKNLFADILRMIAELRPPPLALTA